MTLAVAGALISCHSYESGRQSAFEELCESMHPNLRNRSATGKVNVVTSFGYFKGIFVSFAPAQLS